MTHIALYPVKMYKLAALTHTCLVISGPDRQTYEMRQGRAD